MSLGLKNIFLIQNNRFEILLKCVSKGLLIKKKTALVHQQHGGVWNHRRLDCLLNPRAHFTNMVKHTEAEIQYGRDFAGDIFKCIIWHEHV